MKRTALADKILMLGVDGMDPRLTCKYVEKGIMPNVKKYIEAGAQREDLVMLGGHPTVTPPMWTTLATGCYANVHGITGFFRNGEAIGSFDYNLDSRLCKAEQLWNVFAEAGKKTLVWHWPGSAWPPSSDSENLYVVDGSSPGSVAMAVATVDSEFLVGASTAFVNPVFKEAGASDASAVCVINDLDLESEEKTTNGLEENTKIGAGSNYKVIYKESQMSSNCSEGAVNLVQSPIKPANGWANAPEGAKEFTILFSKGFINRPALILKNENGIYDKVAMYKNKKATEPIVICKLGEMVPEVVDEAIKNDVHYNFVNRNMKLLKLDPEGNSLTMYISSGMDMTNDSVWHPTRLFKEVTENVGYPTSTAMLGQQNSMLITDCMLANWEVSANWQAKSILHLIESEKLDIVFSHYHAIDLQEHMLIKHLADKPENRQPIEVAESWVEDIYKQADRYLGQFLHLLDKGWTILIFSDHALVAAEHDIPMLIDVNGTCTPLMEELGYTVLKRNEKGERIGEVDWNKTKAIMQRDGHIYLNIRGRDKHGNIDGIVDPADKYELEEQIMTDLYGLKDPKTGHRIVAVALRNKDAVLLGMGGPEAGDIYVWIAEGYNFDHGDSLATAYGAGETSVSPIFIAAGKGLKKGYRTERIIRQIDFAPTVAVLGGVRMPAQCEGAPVYQILAEEY